MPIGRSAASSVKTRITWVRRFDMILSHDGVKLLQPSPTSSHWLFVLSSSQCAACSITSTRSRGLSCTAQEFLSELGPVDFVVRVLPQDVEQEPDRSEHVAGQHDAHRLATRQRRYD